LQGCLRSALSSLRSARINTPGSCRVFPFFTVSALPNSSFFPPGMDDFSLDTLRWFTALRGPQLLCHPSPRRAGSRFESPLPASPRSPPSFLLNSFPRFWAPSPDARFPPSLITGHFPVCGVVPQSISWSPPFVLYGPRCSFRSSSAVSPVPPLHVDLSALGTRTFPNAALLTLLPTRWRASL